MPECHRCQRTFATADVRRTPKGHVCKDAIACKRRLSLTVTPLTTIEQADLFEARARIVADTSGGNDPLAFLHAIASLHETTVELVGQVLQLAAKQTRLTQRQLAAAIDVPASTLAGLRKTGR